jgi:prefoldin subunit 5
LNTINIIKDKNEELTEHIRELQSDLQSVRKEYEQSSDKVRSLYSENEDLKMKVD